MFKHTKMDKKVVDILSIIVYNTKQCEVRRKRGGFYHVEERRYP